MSTKYIDSDGDEWNKSCTSCYLYTRDMPYNNGRVSGCTKFNETLNENGSFKQYWSHNTCPHYRPKS